MKLVTISDNSGQVLSTVQMFSAEQKEEAAVRMKKGGSSADTTAGLLIINFREEDCHLPKFKANLSSQANDLLLGLELNKALYKLH